MSKKRKVELEIQKRMSLETGGCHESCPAGITDIVTDKSLIEIKNWVQWKTAIGQLIVYSKYFPGRILKCHLFGKKPEGKSTMILQHFADHNIEVTIEPYIPPLTRKRKLMDKKEDNSILFSLPKHENHDKKQVSDAVINNFLTFVYNLDDSYGNTLFTHDITETIIRAIINDQDFVITLEMLANWLSITKISNLKRLLNTHEEGTEYITIYKNTSAGGTMKEVIKLTMDCVKKLSLRSKGKRADQVMEYFIRMEKMYRKYIAGIIEKRLEEESKNSECKL